MEDKDKIRVRGFGRAPLVYREIYLILRCN